MGKTAIIDYAIATNDVAELVRGFDSDATVGRIVLFRSRIPPVCEEWAGKTRLSEDCFEDTDYREIDRHVYSLVREWYDSAQTGTGAGITEFRGVELGGFVEYKFAEVLLRIYKDATALCRIIKDGGASLVLCCESPEFRETAIHVCRERGAGFEEKRRPPRPVTHSIYDSAEWSAVEKGTIEILESLVYLDVPCADRERRILLHDGSRFRVPFAEAGCGTEELNLREHPAGFLKALLRNLPAIIRARFQAGKVKRGASSHFAETWKRLEADDKFHSVFRYGGLTLWPLVRPYLREIFLWRFPAVAAAIAYRRHIHKTLGVEAIIVNDDVQLIKKIDLAAVEGPSLYMQHGVSGESNGEDLLRATFMANWGEVDRAWRRGLGNPPEKLVVTGNPRFDRLARHLDAPPKAWKDELMERLNLQDLSDLVVFAAQVAPKRSAYDTDDEEEVLAWGICRAMARFPHKRLIVKLHPRQRSREGMYREIAERCGLKGYGIIRDMQLSRLLAHCELFITESSTAAYEALLWDLPILIVNLTRREDIVPYVPGGVALGAYNERHIVPALKKLLEDDESRNRLAANRGRFIERYLYRMDGRASHRVVELLGRMAGVQMKDEAKGV